MKYFRTFCIMILLLVSLVTNAQKDTAAVNKLLQDSKNHLQEKPDFALKLALKAKELSKQIKFASGEAYAEKNIGLVYLIQGNYVEALDHYQQSLHIFKQLDDKIGIANLLNNIGSIYANQGDDAKALEYCLKSLKIAEQTGDKLRIMSALINVGSIYHNKKDERAINYLLQALPLCEEIGDMQASGIIAANIGEIYADSGNEKKAFEYYRKVLSIDENALSAAYAYSGLGKLHLKRGNFKVALNNHFKALAISEKLDEKLFRMRTLKGIANAYLEQNNYDEAINYFVKAQNLGEQLQANVELKDLYQDMSLAYTKVADYPKALLYKSKYADIKDTLYKDETLQKIGRLQFDFDLYKKEGEITLLTKEKALQESQLIRQKLAKNALLIGLGLLLLIAILIYRNYRIKVKTNKILDRQKDQIESLLLNILPSEIAKELQETGTSTPRNYDSVSVLFTDFKGFTSIADKMSPQELVKELSACFVAFDTIIEKNNLEKIKTIGDSYMCAGGVPTPDLQHPFKIVKAGLEIQQYIETNNKQRMEKGLVPWDARIGIHVGPIVAGVVGNKKYAYDIWGSTVNIASRMESNGSPGKVNISSALYELVKEKYICSHRGKIHAKNVGDIDMYFVEGEIEFQKEDTSLINLKNDPEVITEEESEIIV